MKMQIIENEKYLSNIDKEILNNLYKIFKQAKMPEEEIIETLKDFYFYLNLKPKESSMEKIEKDFKTFNEWAEYLNKVTLKNLTEALKNVGISAKQADESLKSALELINEFALKWKDITEEKNKN